MVVDGVGISNSEDDTLNKSTRVNSRLEDCKNDEQDKDKRRTAMARAATAVDDHLGMS